MRRLILALLPLAAATSSHAATYCVDSDAGFRSALEQAALSSIADEIRLTTAVIEFDADVQTPQPVSGDLVIRGGYSAGCAAFESQSSMGHLRGALIESARPFSLRLSVGGNLLVERIESSSFTRTQIEGTVQFLQTNQIRFNRTFVIDNDEGLHIESNGHNVRIENSLIALNGWTHGGVGLTVSASRNNLQNDPQVSIANVTASKNGYGIDIRRAGGGAALPVEIINLISWRNIEGDLRLQRPTRLSYSIVGIMDLASPSSLHPDSRENHGSDPQLTPDMRLLTTSPAINSGSNAAFPGVSINHATDVRGTRRLIGGRVDRGATESYVD